MKVYIIEKKLEDPSREPMFSAGGIPPKFSRRRFKVWTTAGDVKRHLRQVINQGEFSMYENCELLEATVNRTATMRAVPVSHFDELLD